MLLNLLLLVIGLAGLYYGSEWLVTGASRIAEGFRISPLIIGLTIVAIGTSVPELVVSILAAFDGRPGLALGNVIGSNIANIGLILGLTGTVHVISVEKGLVKREIPIMIGATIFATILAFDGQLNRLDGVLLLFGFIVFSAFFYYISQHENGNGGEDIQEDIASPETDENGAVKVHMAMEFGRIVIGLTVLVIGARLLVNGAVSIAEAMGVSDLVIAVTMVALGTSLPELATSLTAAFKGQGDMAVGNVIGSNVANLLLVLGATSTVATIDIGQTDLSIVEYIVMLIFSIALLPFVRNRKLSRIESAFFLGFYFAFIIYSLFFSR
ncbi:MAG: calcium/sodium antiporter [Anaerolineae bacterium]|nr:calcium/sodium antiporter [Anaerolineae bacterium]MDQ7036555.1 calcium/sodium antiporter [Anaerolineae bacterium]